MAKIITCTLFIFISLLSFADALPKGYQQYKFETGLKIDSIIVIESDQIKFRDIDTVYHNPYFKIVRCDHNICRTSGSGHKTYQRIIVFSGGQKYYSNIYEPLGSNPTFKVIENDYKFTVIETTSFLFKGLLGEILQALLITLILELVIALFFFKPVKDGKVFITIVLLNVITLPTAWLLFSIDLGLELNPVLKTFLFEFLIFLTECIGLNLIFKKYATSTLIIYTMVANLASFFVGGFIYIVTTFI